MKERILLDGRVTEKERLFNSQLGMLEELKTSTANKKLIREFIRDKQLIGVHNSSITPYLYSLNRLLTHVKKDLAKLNAEDLKSYFSDLQTKPCETGQLYSQVSINNHKRSIKFFYRWKGKGKYPICVEWIKENTKHRTKLPDDMITEEEIRTMISTTNNTRNQAIISVLYDSAARAAEFCGVRIKDVKFDELGAVMHVDGKTGERNIRLINSVPYLQSWLQVHPFRDDPNAFMWHNMQAHKWAEVNRQTLSRILVRAGKKAGIKKRVHPHVFRHSRLTALAPKITEQVLKSFAGWSPDSRMAAIYIHMSGKTIDLALAKAHGLEIHEAKEENHLAPMVCPRCRTKNPGTAMYCSSCSMVLDQKTAIEMDTIRHKDDLTVKAMTEKITIMQKSMEDLFEELDVLRKTPPKG